MKTLLVTGGRDFHEQDYIFRVLDSLQAEHHFEALRHGDAKGVDRICQQWAHMNGLTIECCPADWLNVDTPGAKRRYSSAYGGVYNANAGFHRNHTMLTEPTIPDFAVVFPGGPGTAHMAGLIAGAGIPWVSSGTIDKCHLHF